MHDTRNNSLSITMELVFLAHDIESQNINNYGDKVYPELNN
jgi:hypothetical protein